MYFKIIIRELNQLIKNINYALPTLTLSTFKILLKEYLKEKKQIQNWLRKHKRLLLLINQFISVKSVKSVFQCMQNNRISFEEAENLK
jgi:hypothetical protein